MKTYKVFLRQSKRNFDMKSDKRNLINNLTKKELFNKITQTKIPIHNDYHLNLMN